MRDEWSPAPAFWVALAAGTLIWIAGIATCIRLVHG